MRISPHTNILRSYRGHRTNWASFLGEGVDNAFDAGASSIRIVVDSEHISFTDDGSGITKNRIQSLLSLGDHGAMTTTALGRYGVGIKSQAINAGDVLKVLSTSRDGTFRVSVNWRDLLHKGDWEVPDPVWLPSVVGRTGTTIEVQALRHPCRADKDDLSWELGKRFYPAIAEGKSILLNGKAVGLLAEPQMSDIIDTNVSFADGRSAHIRAGILLGHSDLRQVHVAFRHRVLFSGGFGTGVYGGAEKMFARVNISGPWHLATYKDELADKDESDELEDAIEDAIRPILEKCNTASMEARTDELAARLTDRVSLDVGRAARPKHLHNKERVSANPKRSGGRGFVEPDKAEDGDDGPARTNQRQRGRELKITFAGLVAESGIGDYDGTGRIGRINLSADHPLIADLIKHRDQPMAENTLCLIAFAILEAAAASQPQLKLPLQEYEFGVRVSNRYAYNLDAAKQGVQGA